MMRGSILFFVTLFALSLGGELRDAVKVEGIMGHLKTLEKIAEVGGEWSRSVRTNYNNSADYVMSSLSGLCQLRKQHFLVPVHEEVSAPSLEMLTPLTTPFQHEVDFKGMRYGGEGEHNITAKIWAVAGGGCSSQFFRGFPKGEIALVQEGFGCELVTSALLAQEAGASAVFFHNSASRKSFLTARVRIVDWKEGDPLVKIPTLSLTNTMGKVLSQGDVTVHFYSNQRLTLDWTYNVICDSFNGSPDNVVMAGAHLDSVPEGPGLNDNGSGSSVLLEIAIQFFRLGLQNKNKVRFAWWGAEEIGLLGSRHYVRDLQLNDPASLRKIALYLNFDMLASPNFIPYVHDGHQVNDNIPIEIRESSRKLQILFEEYFLSSSLPYKLNSMYGGSDFLPFLEGHVPSSGLATGAGSIKDAEEREVFGGFANAAFDPCYHQDCDSLLNVSQEALRQCSESASDVIQSLSFNPNLRDYLGSP